MHIIVKKWGNSASVRIPSAIMTAAHVQLNDVVDVHEENGRIIIAPVRPHAYHLQQLVDGITAANLHEAIDFGQAVGKEIF